MSPPSRHQLFGKTLVRVRGVTLTSADLGAVARAVAQALGLDSEQVWVAYAGDDGVDLDIMSDSADLSAWLGHEDAVLAALADTDGVHVEEGAYVTGEGILGSVSWLAGPGARPNEVGAGPSWPAADLDETVRRIQQARARRAAIWATGGEVARGTIKDTNSTYLAEVLRSAGLSVTVDGVLPDDRRAIVAGIESSLGRGAGWILTTGGIGHGDADHTMGAIASLDPELAHHPAVWFRHGGQDHAIEIGVGRVEGAFVIALPGPHDEVRACAARLPSIVTSPNPDKWAIARDLAETIADLYAARRQGSAPPQ